MKPTQTQIAKRIGVSDSQFSRMLSGHQHLEYLTALKLAEIIPSSPIVWIKGGGDSEQRRKAYWDYLLTIEKSL